MAKYVFPAIFTNENPGYSVHFPDVQGCYTDADTLEDALERAEDVLQMVLADLEECGQEIPKPTPIAEIKTDSGSFVVPVLCDTANEKLIALEETAPSQQFGLLVSFMLELLKSGQTDRVISILEKSQGQPA